MQDFRKKFYDMHELADVLGVSYQLIYSLVKNGTINAYKLGRAYRISVNELYKLQTAPQEDTHQQRRVQQFNELMSRIRDKEEATAEGTAEAEKIDGCEQ